MQKIVDFYKKYNEFVALAQNCYPIDLDFDIDTEKKVLETIKDYNVDFIIENNQFKLKKSYTLTKKLKENTFYYNKDKNISYEHLKKTFTSHSYNKKKNKFILALNNFLIELENEERKVVLLYPLEFLEIDELNSIILTNYFKNIDNFYIPIDTEFKQNEILFNKFFKHKLKSQTLPEAINLEPSKIDDKNLNEFLEKRKEELLKELPKTPYKISILNKPIIYIYQLNMMTNLNNLTTINKTLECFLETNLDKKRKYLYKCNSFTPYYGTNTPEYPLAKGQSKVLENYAKGEVLLPVIGAPGTGKTTLFKSIIANTITNRALSIIFENKDYNNSMLVTSTTNKAIENVTSDIEKENPFIMGYLNLLSQADKNSSTKKAQILNMLTESITKELNLSDKYHNLTLFDGYIQYLNDKKHKLIQNKNLKEEIKNIKNQIDKEIELFYELEKNKEFLETDITQLNQIIQDIKNNLNPIQEKTNSIYKKLNKSFINLQESKTFFLETLTSPINEYHQTLDKIKNSNFISKFIHKILKTQEKAKTKCKNSLNPNLLDIEFDTLLQDIYEIREIYRDDRIYENEDILKELLPKKNKIDNLHKKLQQSQFSKNDFDTTINEFFRNKLYKLNYKLYILSEIFIINHIIDNYNKDKILHYLQNSRDILEGKYKEKLDLEEALKVISAFFPVIAATIKKINLISSYKKRENLFFATLIDEAGMIPNANILFPINLSKQAVIVGDPKQLQPISELEEFLQIDFINSLSDEEKKYNEIFKPYKYSAYDISAGVNLIENDCIANAYILDEHRRCQKDIAELFIDVAEYKDLHIKTNPKKPYNLFNKKYLEFFECCLNTKPTQKNTNEFEIECIEYVLDELEKANIDLSTQVGIITPYKNQEELLIKKFENRLNHSKDRPSIGTIHKFQGVEFDVILFSSVINPYMKSTSFVTNNINLLNVSISRAKNLYIHIGDYTLFQNFPSKVARNYIKHFKDTIKYKEILLAKEKLEIKSDKLDILKKYPYQPKKLFSIQNIIDEICHLISNAKSNILIVLPWISEKGLRYISKNADLTNIRNGKVKINFRVLYQNKDEEKEKLKDIYLVINEVFNQNFTQESWQKNFVSHGTHEKILIVDRTHFLLTSLNYLSSGFFENPKKYNLRDETAVVEGPHYVWSYIYNRQKTLGIDKKRIDEEFKKFKESIEDKLL